jgi:DNA-directed RNA polymerase I subunit RPA1
MNEFRPGSTIGSISEKLDQQLKRFISEDKAAINSIFKQSKVNPNSFRFLYGVKYLNSLVSIGECVGCTAAQAIGEPST